MNFYVLGKKSKYLFFRELVEDGGTSHETIQSYTQQTLEVAHTGENAPFTSPHVPLFTRLFFQVRDKLPKEKQTFDNFLVFDEPPYCSKPIEKIINTLITDYPYSHVTVILCDNGKKNQEITSEEAIKFYKTMGVPAILYEKGNIKPFLYFQRKSIRNSFLHTMLNKVTLIEQQSKDRLALECDLIYGLELGEVLESEELENLFYRHSPYLEGKNIVSHFAMESKKHCFESNATKFVTPYLNLYQSMTEDMVFWSQEQDKKALTIYLEEHFLPYFSSLPPAVFTGLNQQDYEDFLEEQELVDKFQEKLQNFFQSEIESLLYQYILNKVEVLKREIS